MSNFLILGDVHIGAGSSLGKSKIGATNSRLLDQSNLLDWTLETALQNNCHDIFITGDIFEEPKPAPWLITLFISWLKKCQIEKINVHIIMGNHDFIRIGSNVYSPLDIIAESELEFIHIYKNIHTVYIDTTAITLLPFRDRKSFMTESNSDALKSLKNIIDYESISIPKIFKKIMIGHMAIEGSIPVGDEFDDLSNELFCNFSMFNAYDYVWMGHVHKPQILQKQPYIAHIGSMDVSNFGETDQKKHVIIYDTDKDSFKKEFLPTRNLKKIEIVIPKDVENSTEYVLKKIEELKKLEDSIVKIELSLPQEIKSPNKSIIEKKIYELGAYNIASISENKKSNVIKKEKASNITSKLDISSAIKMYSEKIISEENRNNFISLANDIYAQFKSEAK